MKSIKSAWLLLAAFAILAVPVTQSRSSVSSIAIGPAPVPPAQVVPIGPAPVPPQR
jgi:hypothetical protein